jgi:collagenase-like PrtC family protease
VEGVIQAVNGQGIPVRYTFTNPLLNEHDCEDPYCNYLMQAADNGMNEVMIFSPILEKYLREKYPNFAYNSSTCKEIKDVDEINREMERDYKYVVLDYNFNNKWDILDKIERKDKLEVLVNTLCEPGCKRRGEHYRQIAKDQKTMLLNRTLPADKQIPIKHWHCDYGEYNCVHTIQDYPTFISPEDIWEKYIPAGINNFKIEGRTGNLFSLIDTYCFFMLKPEKAGEARLLLLRNLEKSHVITVSKPRPGQWP